MQGLMQDPREIDLSLIPPADLELLAATFLQAARRFYENPENEMRFQEWLHQRNTKQAV